MKRLFLLSVTLLILFQCFEVCTVRADDLGGTAAEAETASCAGMRFEDGMAQPVLTYSAPDMQNEDSEILRLCVYVETDHDTDGDGMADLVKVFLQLPRMAAEGRYAAAAIYDPTPYSAGVFTKTKGKDSYPFAEDSFDYSRLYAEGKKRTPAGELSTLTAAKEADPSAWLYTDPGDEDTEGYYDKSLYDYFLIRGFAVVKACGIGTYGSEGFELCGTDLERDCHKCVVEWLTGDRIAFADRTGMQEIKADWCNGNVAMTGKSYGGTLSYEVAVTGVKGLKTVIPVAGISNWYDYRNSQGVTRYGSANYTDILASYNAGACFMDDTWSVVNDEYGAWLKQTAADEIRANGNYSDIWAGRDYSVDTEAIACSALIVHGLNDFNVLTKQSDLMVRAFENAGQTVKLLLHQDSHAFLYGTMVGEMLYEELVNKWLCHYLYNVDNGIENFPAVTVQSNVDGSYGSFDSWTDAETRMLHAKPAEKPSMEKVVIRSGVYDSFYGDYLAKDAYPEAFFTELDEEHALVLSLDVPACTTVYGIPEVHVKLSTQDVDQDNLMVTAILMDVSADGEPFHAYMQRQVQLFQLPRKTVGTFEYGGGHKPGDLKELVLSPTYGKLFSKGWIDLMDPGAGYISSEMPEPTPLEAGRYYDYTIYLTPTVYTLEEGHELKLLLLAQDPYESRNDDIDDNTPGFKDYATDAVYSFTVDCDAVSVDLPVLSGN